MASGAAHLDSGIIEAGQLPRGTRRGLELPGAAVAAPEGLLAASELSGIPRMQLVASPFGGRLTPTEFFQAT